MQIRDRVQELRRVRAGDLTPNPKNWRTHPKAQADALRGILAEVGYADALLARELPDGSLMLVDGHLRAETTPEQEVPVLVLDIDEAEADKLLLSLDPLAALAETNAVALDQLLREVDTGSEGLQQMYADLAEAAELYQDDAKEIVEDEIPEPPVDPITKPGDLWILGEHRLLCGDSTKAEDVERLMAGAKADAVITDPPYGVGYVGKTKDALPVTNDGRDGLPKLLAKSLSCANEISFPGCSWYVCAPPGPQFFDFAAVLKSLGIWRQTLAWVKQTLVLGHSDYHYQHECIFYGWTSGGKRHWGSDRCQVSVWEEAKGIDLPAMKKADLVSLIRQMISERDQQNSTVLREDRPTASRDHPTMKPVRLFARMMQNSTMKTATAFDPFLGSGTTLIAAEQLGRKCYGMEISPAYCDVIVKRWETLTGKKATREEVKRGKTRTA
jgi:DNA modification methylase